MSKKNKKNLQKLLEKKRALQEISSHPTAVTKPAILPSFRPAPTSPTPHISIEAEVEPAASIPSHHSKEIIRTLVSVFIIAVLMTGTIIVDKKTAHFTSFGNWLYRTF
ncbi:MAG TPA: hypothetical protein VMQ44_00780 [Candidatus Saccharimonadales bacterium]|nr:hypothetical protein [Candidatus Saccharimonadales bacterium]